MSGPGSTWNPGRILAMLAVAGLAGAGLAGCGGASSTGTAGATGTAATTSSAPTAAASTTASADSGSGEKVSFTDTEACAWAKEEVAALKKVTDPLNAQLNIVGSLSNFFDTHGGLENAGSGGYAVDDATKRACPTEHDLLIKKAKIKSFGSL